MKSSSPSSFPVSWRIANLIMTVFFFLAALANTNDGDWYLWSLIYLFPGILSLPVFLKPSTIGNSVWQSLMSIQLGGAILVTVYQATLVFAVFHKMAPNPFIHEEGREMGGILIILGWTVISRFYPFSRGGDGKKFSNFYQSQNNATTGLLLVALALGLVPLGAWSLCLISDWHKHLGHCSGMFNK